MTHDKQSADDRHLPKPEKRNLTFEQEVADSHDRDKQTGKDDGEKTPAKTSSDAPKTS